MARWKFALTLLGSMLFAAGCAPGNPELDDEEVDESDDALSGARLVFGADFSESVEGKLRAGDPVELSYDASRLPSCRGDQGGVPQWSITAFYRVGGGDVQSVPVAGLNATSPVLIVPPATGQLELWFQVTNRWGCVAYDSDFGQNYRFSVAAAAGQPGWVGNPASVVDRWTCGGGPCELSRVALDKGFRYDTWARQRATVAGLYFDVWEEGVTDWDNPDLWKEVDAQVHFRFTGQSAFTARYVDFLHRVNHDARYQVVLRTIDPFFAKPSVVPAEQCPDMQLTRSADGQYVFVEVELYFTADSVELRPAPQQTFKGRFEDYAAPYAACL
ncbi:MAG: DUF6209 family protein [Polyangiaceae bacterium]